MTIPIYQADSFTHEPFHGNPAGVCILNEEATEAWMQAVAAEMNLSETAFLLRRSDNEFSIRWFTPKTEVPLCGHATLASARVLWEEQLASPARPLVLAAQVDVLTAELESDWIRLDFPALPVAEHAPAGDYLEVLGAAPVGVYRNRFDTYLVELDSERAVRNLCPDAARLRQSGLDPCIVTAPGEAGDCDFVSRFFAPGIGIEEDPVTGSAHCSLGPFWADRLGKTELLAQQVSDRAGVVKMRVRGDRVHLLGQAVTVLRGELLCAAAVDEQEKKRS